MLRTYRHAYIPVCPWDTIQIYTWVPCQYMNILTIYFLWSLKKHLLGCADLKNCTCCLLLRLSIVSGYGLQMFSCWRAFGFGPGYQTHVYATRTRYLSYGELYNNTNTATAAAAEAQRHGGVLLLPCLSSVSCVWQKKWSLCFAMRCGTAA